MKKLYSFFAACALVSSALTASAEKVVTAMTSVGEKVTSLSQLEAGKTILFRAVARDGYLYENDNKLWLSRGVPSSGISSYYLFKVETFTNNGGDATVTFKTPAGHNMPNLTSGKSSDINDQSTFANFTITPGQTIDPALGDSIWFIQDEAGLYFNGNQLVSTSPVFGTYGTFAGWSASGGNSQYQIFIPETETKTLYTITVDGVDEQQNALYDTKTFELGMGDSLTMPSQVGYSIDWDNSFTEDGNPIEHTEAGYYKVTGDAGLNLTYKIKPLPFTPIAAGTDTTWYFLKIRDNFYCYYDPATNAATEAGAIPTVNRANNHQPDAYLWAFDGDRENGFRLINKKAGNGMVLTAANTTNGAANYLAEAPGDPAATTYEYSEKVAGKFTLKLKNVENAYINQFGGQTGKLRFYVHANGTDAGSQFTVVKYDADSIKKSLMDAKLAIYAPYIASEGYVNGYTAAQLADIKTAYQNKDSVAGDAAVEVLKTQTRIAFDPSKTYAIVSAYAWKGDNEGKKYALAFGDSIATGDSLRRITWSELPSDIQQANAGAGYKWKFTQPDAAKNVNELEKGLYRGDNDSMHVFYAIENQMPSTTKVAGQSTQMYVGDFWFGQKVPVVASDSIFKMYLQDTKTPGIYTILGFHETENASGVKTYTRVGITLTGVNQTATQGATASANTIFSTSANTNAFYLLEVTPAVTTSINSATVAKAAEEGQIFDLTGRKVTKAQKGLYIINGKKAVVK